MDNYKKELIARIEHYIVSKGYKKTDWYHGISFTMPDGFELKAISWDNQTENKGKLFFDCFKNYMQWNEAHEQPLAEDCSVEVLKAICDKYDMRLYSGFFTEKMWNEIPLLDWDEMSWGQKNIHLEIVHTQRLHIMAATIGRMINSSGVNLETLDYICELFDKVIRIMNKETEPDKPECLENESVISLMGGLKSSIYTIMQP